MIITYSKQLKNEDSTHLACDQRPPRDQLAEDAAHGLALAQERLEKTDPNVDRHGVVRRMQHHLKHRTNT